MARLALCLMLSFAASIMVFSTASRADGRISILVRNSGFEFAHIIVYDNLCQETVFKGRIIENGSRGMSICANRRNRGEIIVYDRYGQGELFSDVGDGARVAVRLNADNRR